MSRSFRALGCAAAVVLGLGAGRAADAQVVRTGPQVVTFFSDVDDSEQPYGLYVPKGFDPAKSYPLVVMLHGAGSNHRLDLRRVFGKSNGPGETDVEASRTFPEWADVDFLVAAPLARGTMGYQGVAEKDVYDVLADVKKRFRVDDDRVYLTGLSMGGGGTLWVGLSRPDVWAAIAPVCPAPPEGTIDLAGNALNVPVHIFQGGADPLVKPEGVREWVKRFEDLGTKVKYTEYPGVSHDSWVNAYEGGAVFKLFANHKRDRHPDRVRFATRDYKHGGAYWVRLDALAPGTLASIDAKFTAPNEVEVTTSGVNGFTIDLAGHPKFAAGQPHQVTVDGKTFHTQRGRLDSFRKDKGAWAAGKAEPGRSSKRPGAEGPMSEAVASRHVYVYGTADDPSADELKKRREEAARAADWSMKIDWSSPMAAFFAQIRPPLAFFRVLSDKEVRPSDIESANLVLFGTKETNSLIAKQADRLPIHLKAGTADHGLVYVYPSGGRYVLISSGLPWWSDGGPRPLGAVANNGAGRRPRFRFMNWPAGLLGEFEDFLLFKGTTDDVVASGRFGGDWDVPEGALAKLKASGVVTLGAGGGTSSASGAGPVGTWALKYDAPDGSHAEPVLTLSKDGDGLKGSYKNGGEAEVVAKDVAYKEGELTFKVNGVYNGQPYTLTYKGKPEGGAIRGEVHYEYGEFSGEFDFEGKRSPASAKE